MDDIYNTDNGIILHDPTPDILPVLSALNKDFMVRSITPGYGFIPKHQKLKNQIITTDKSVFDLQGSDQPAYVPPDETFQTTTFNYWYAQSLKEILRCGLCGSKCGANRYYGIGKCGLGKTTYNSEAWIHIGEEDVINPAVTVNMSGCMLACIYCITHLFQQPHSLPETDTESFWSHVSQLETQGVPLNTIEFTNPTESIHGVYSIMSKTPDDFNLPIVFNSHLYGSERFYEIANPITDVWLPDLRYGNNDCAKRLSKVSRYMEYAIKGLECIIGNRIIVRILIQPGHFECCQKPALDLLSNYRDKLWVSILDQYVPEHMAHTDPDLCRRPTEKEISQVHDYAYQLGLRDINTDHNGFWEVD